MIYSIGVGVLLTVIAVMLKKTTVSDLLYNVQVFDLEGFLMKGALCFMLFAGSCHIKIKDCEGLAKLTMIGWE